jgi:hypothetical protein
MRPAKAKLHGIMLGERPIVHLQGAVESNKMRDWALGLAIGRIGDPRRAGAPLRRIIARIAHSWPVLARPRAGWSTGAVVSSANGLGEAFRGTHQALVDRLENERCTANPIGQRHIDALSGVDLSPLV